MKHTFLKNISWEKKNNPKLNRRRETAYTRLLLLRGSVEHPEFPKGRVTRDCYISQGDLAMVVPLAKHLMGFIFCQKYSGKFRIKQTKTFFYIIFVAV